MSSLSFENIDRWLFEYTEGNLSSEQVGQLEQFISQHPELELELDAWKSAKIMKETGATVEASAFQKSFNMWPALATLFISIIGVSSFFYFYEFSVETKYAQKAIDLDFIAEDDEFVFTQNPNAPILTEITSDKSTSQSLVYAGKTKVNNGTNNFKTDATNSSSNQTYVTERKSLSITIALNELTTLEKSAIRTTDISSPENELTDWLFEAPEHEQVKLSLNNNIGIMNNTANRDFTKSSALKSKSAFSKQAKSILRKVQRMMDQPVALRNFKDPHYAIPNLSSYQANFGMAGSMIQHRFQATSRNQWVGRENQQLMNRLAWDGYVRPLRGGIGIDLNYNDYQDGSIHDMSFGLTYSPKLSVARNVSFEPAVRFKMGMKELDLNAGIIGSTVEMNRRNAVSIFENEQTPLGSQLWYRDMGVGALVNTKWFYAGLNLDNLGRHYNNYYSSDLTQNYNADLDFSAVFGTEYKSLNKDITMSTYAYYQNFGQINEVWGGANIRWKNIQLGAAISNNIDLGATAGIVFDRFTIHYNLDYLESVVLNEKMVSHQVTMRMLLKPSRLTMKFLNM